MKQYHATALTETSSNGDPVGPTVLLLPQYRRRDVGIPQCGISQAHHENFRYRFKGRSGSSRVTVIERQIRNMKAKGIELVSAEI